MKKNQGFTIIELIVVMVIVGILAAVAMPKFVDLSSQASSSSVQGVAGAISAGSSTNFAAKKVGNPSAVAVSSNNVCTNATLQTVVQGGTLPAGYTVSGTGDCSAATTDSVSCTLTGSNAASTTFTVYCAR